MGKTHVALGAAFGLGVVALAQPPVELSVMLVAVSAYSGLTPDIDHPHAPAARFLGPVSWLLCRAVRSISWRTTGDVHRGWSHSLTFCVLWGLLVGGGTGAWTDVRTGWWIGFAAFVGAVSHLFGDMCTLSGCDHVLWPYRVHLSVLPRMLRFRTGGGFETFLMRQVLDTRVPRRRRRRARW